MKKLFLVIALLLSFNVFSFSQTNSDYVIDFTNPESVVNAIFYAAQSHDFAILQGLCDPFGEGDGNTERICLVSDVADGTFEGDYDPEEILIKFVDMLENCYIHGNVTYELDSFDGSQKASVPFSCPGRGEETMNLVNRYGNWYLFSF